MWYGKVGVILWVFSVMLIFFSYYFNTIFNNSAISQSATFSSLTALQGTFAFNQSLDASLVFGDFIHVFTFLGSLFTGGAFSTALTLVSNTGFVDTSIQLFMGILYSSGTLFLLLYIASFRSI